VPKKEYFRGILLYYFIQKLSSAEAHRILVETTGTMFCRQQYAEIGLDVP